MYINSYFKFNSFLLCQIFCFILCENINNKIIIPFINIIKLK